MTTRQPPTEPGDGLQTARAVARRVDKLEPAVREVERGLGALDNRVGQVQRGLTVLLQREAPDDAEAGKGQPDWLGCRDPAAARAMLTDTYRWLEDTGAHLGLSVRPDCWPWHPRAVFLLRVAFTHYTAVMGGDSATAVSEYVTRYQGLLETLARRAIGDECNAEAHKHQGGGWYLYDLARLDDYAIWWATSREGDPPGLTPRVQAVR